MLCRFYRHPVLVCIFSLSTVVASLNHDHNHHQNLDLDLDVDLDFSYDSMNELATIHTSACTYNALKQYLDQCTATSFDLVDSHLRLELAVKLSICEFEEAAVDFPAICKALQERRDYFDCVQQFRGSSQLWTTYSGNYRRLRSMCYEESYPHAKNHIIELFANITKVYSGFYETLLASFDKVYSRQDELASQLLALLALVNEASVRQKDELEKSLDESENHFAALRNIHTDFSARMSARFEELVHEMVQLADALNTAKKHTFNLGTDIQNVGNDLALRGNQLLEVRNIESDALIATFHELLRSVSASSQMAEHLEQYLQHIASHAGVQTQILQGNSEALENVKTALMQFQDQLADVHGQIYLNTSLLTAAMRAISNSAEETRNSVENHYLQVSDMLVNMTDKFSAFSNRFAAFPAGGIGSLFLALASYAVRVLATGALSILGALFVLSAVKSRKIARFALGLVLGVVCGIFLRLAMLRILLAALGAFPIITHFVSGWVQDLVR